MWDKEWVWSKSFCEDRLREAAQRRLEEEALRARARHGDPRTGPNPRVAQRTVIWIGKHLVMWGTQLQAHFGESEEQQALQLRSEQS